MYDQQFCRYSGSTVGSLSTNANQMEINGNLIFNISRLIWARQLKFSRYTCLVSYNTKMKVRSCRSKVKVIYTWSAKYTFMAVAGERNTVQPCMLYQMMRLVEPLRMHILYVQIGLIDFEIFAIYYLLLGEILFTKYVSQFVIRISIFRCRILNTDQIASKRNTHNLYANKVTSATFSLRRLNRPNCRLKPHFGPFLWDRSRWGSKTGSILFLWSGDNFYLWILRVQHLQFCHYNACNVRNHTFCLFFLVSTIQLAHCELSS